MSLSTAQKMQRAEESAITGKARFLIFAALLIVEAAVQYWSTPGLEMAAGLAAFAAWVVAIPRSDKSSVRLSLTLVAIGMAIFAVVGVDPLTAIVSFGENASVLMIMVLVPLVGLVINLGGYSDALGEIARHTKRPVYLYVIALFLSYAIGSVLLNAAIALVWAVLAPIIVQVGRDPSAFLVPSLPRGYNASLLWSPSTPAMATALSLTGTEWSSIVKPGFWLSLVFLTLAVVVESRHLLGPQRSGRQDNFAASKPEPAEPNAQPADDRANRQAWLKTAVLALGLGSFIVAIVILQELGFSIYESIVPCIFATLLIWGVLIRRSKETWSGAAKYFTVKVPGLSSQFLLMTTAGFIGTALKAALRDGIPGVNGTFHPGILTYTLLTSFLVWATSALGIHPLIGMTAVYSVVAPLSQGVTPAYLSLTLLMGAAMGFSISPVSATILVTSSCAGQSSVEVGPKRQWKFVIVTWLICSVLLSRISV